MRDFLEAREDAAEARFFEMQVDQDHLRCACGKIFHINEGQTLSPDPYAMPVCPDCFKEYLDKYPPG